MNRRNFIMFVVSAIIGILGLKTTKADKTKPLNERRFWPIDWSDVRCPICNEQLLGLMSPTTEGNDLYCTCYHCRHKFRAKYQLGKWHYKITN